MRWLYNLTTKAKVLVLTVFMLLLMTVVAFVGVRASGEISDAADRLYLNELQGLSYIKEAKISLIYAGRAMRNMLLSQEDSRVDQHIHEQAVLNHEAQVGEYLAKAETLFYTEAGKKKLAEIQAVYRDYMDAQYRILSLAKQEEMVGIRELHRDSVYRLEAEVRPLADRLDHLMTEATSMKEANAKRAIDEAYELYQTSKDMIIFVVILSGLFGLGLGVMLGNRMGKNAKEMVNVMQKVELDQNFDIRVRIEDQDELGLSGIALNSLLTKLQMLIDEANHILSEASRGEFKHRIDASYQGDLKRLADGINENLEKLMLQQQSLLHAERISTVGQMSASIAHEINNPVSGVLANLLYLKAVVDTNLVEQQEVLDESVVELRRIASIVQGLLNFSRTDQLNQVEETDVVPVVQQTLSLMRSLFLQHNVELVCNTDKSPKVVMLDVAFFKQILTNLLVNATQAIKEVSHAKIYLDLYQKDDRTYLSVTDNGAGVPEALRDKIFDPFFTTKPTGEGTGLGLSLSVSMAQSFGAMLYLDTNYSNGSRFVLSLANFSKS